MPRGCRLRPNLVNKYRASVSSLIVHPPDFVTQPASAQGDHGLAAVQSPPCSSGVHGALPPERGVPPRAARPPSSPGWIVAGNGGGREARRAVGLARGDWPPMGGGGTGK